jgi:hypothetical protein
MTTACLSMQVVWFKETSTMEVSLGGFICSIQLPSQCNAEEVCPRICDAHVQTQGRMANAYRHLQMYM